MQMKIKELIPPILLKYLRVTKEYADFDAANSKTSNGAYQNEILCNVVAAKTKAYISKLHTKPYELNATNVFLLAGINNCMNVSQSKDLNIVDYGGACGIHYYDIKRFYPDYCKLKWTVVETPQMVKTANRLSLTTDELSFTDSIDNVNTTIDMLYTSCALHYVSKPYDELEKILNKNAKWILFNRMMFNQSDRDIYTVQKSQLSSNGPGQLPEGFINQDIYYPHTTLSFSKFLKCVQSKYDLYWQFDETTGIFQINRERIFGKGMLFKLKI